MRPDSTKIDPYDQRAAQAGRLGGRRRCRRSTPHALADITWLSTVRAFARKCDISAQGYSWARCMFEHIVQGFSHLNNRKRCWLVVWCVKNYFMVLPVASLLAYHPFWNYIRTTLTVRYFQETQVGRQMAAGRERVCIASPSSRRRASCCLRSPCAGSGSCAFLVFLAVVKVTEVCGTPCILLCENLVSFVNLAF